MAHAAIIFGVDGALGVPKRDGYRATCNQAFAEAGLDWCRDVGLYGELLAVTGGSSHQDPVLRRSCRHRVKFR